MNFKNPKLSLLPLFVGALHGLLMILTRMNFESSHFSFYHHTVSVHAFSLVSTWPILLAMEQGNQWRGQRLLQLMFLLLYFVSVGIIWFSKILVQTKYIITPESLEFLTLQLLSSILIFCSATYQIGKLFFERKGQKEANSADFTFFPLQLCLVLIGTIGGLSFFNSAVGFLNRAVVNPDDETLWLGLGHLPIQLMSIIGLALWLNWIDFTNDQTSKVSSYLRYSIWSVPFFLILVLLNQLGFVPWSQFVPLIPNLFIIPVVLFVGLKMGFHLNKQKNHKSKFFYFMAVYLLFVAWGGVTGLQLMFDPLVRAMTTHTLLMPSHFHPLVAAGFTGSVLGWQIFFKSQPKSRWNHYLGFVFLVSIAVMSLGLRWGGMSLWPRRNPVLMTDHPLAFLLIEGGGIVASLSLAMLAVRVLKHLKTEQE